MSLGSQLKTFGIVDPKYNIDSRFSIYQKKTLQGILGNTRLYFPKLLLSSKNSCTYIHAI